MSDILKDECQNRKEILINQGWEEMNKIQVIESDLMVEKTSSMV